MFYTDTDQNYTQIIIDDSAGTATFTPEQTNFTVQVDNIEAYDSVEFCARVSGSENDWTCVPYTVTTRPCTPKLLYNGEPFDDLTAGSIF